MKIRGYKKANKRLNERRDRYERTTSRDKRAGTRRPGSQNPKRSAR